LELDSLCLILGLELADEGEELSELGSDGISG